MLKCYVFKKDSIVLILYVIIRVCYYIFFLLVINKFFGFFKVYLLFGKGDSFYWDWKKIEIKLNF